MGVGWLRRLARRGGLTCQEDWPNPILLTSGRWLAALPGSQWGCHHHYCYDDYCCDYSCSCCYCVSNLPKSSQTAVCLALPSVAHFLDNASSIAAVSRCRRPGISKSVQFAHSSGVLAFKARRTAANEPTLALGCILTPLPSPAPPLLLVLPHLPTLLETDSAPNGSAWAVCGAGRALILPGGSLGLPRWSSEIHLELPGRSPPFPHIGCTQNQPL